MHVNMKAMAKSETKPPMTMFSANRLKAHYSSPNVTLVKASSPTITIILYTIPPF